MNIKKRKVLKGNNMTYEELFDMFENGTEKEKEWAEMAIENRFFYWLSCALDCPSYKYRHKEIKNV